MFNYNYKKTIMLGSYSLLIMILSIFIVSCGDDDDEEITIPVAKFVSEINFLEVAFTNESNDAEVYQWDFGVEGDDTDVSTDQSPSYTYSAAGTYTVTLIVANSTGGSDVEQVEIIVRAAVLPTANFESAATTGFEVVFTDGSENVDTYAWDFGVDGVETDTSTVASPAFTFPADGDYVVSLTVTSTDGFTDTETKTITVTRVAVVPVAEFSFMATELEITFTDGSTNAESYLWDFGIEGVDTDTSTVASPSFTYSDFGTYDVSLTVTSSTGDTETETKAIVISQIAVIPMAEFSFAATDLAVSFTDGSSNAESYFWDFGVEGVESDTSDVASPSFTYPTFGTYEASLTVTSSTGDVDTETMSVVVSLPTPVAGFTFVATDLDVTFTNTSSDADTFSWDFGDGSAANTTESPTHTYATGGDYTVILTATTGDNQTDTETMQVQVIDPNSTDPVAAFTFIADDLQVTFTDASVNAVTYAWDFGDGNSSTEESPVHTYAATGSYTVELTITNSEAATDTETMMVDVVDPAPVADFTFLANDLEVAFTNASENAVSYAWDFGDGSSSTDASPVHTYATAGTYTVELTITNDVGTDAETMMVTVTGATATFAAVLQNADFETYPTGENNNNDLVDAWTIDPDNTFNNGTDTPFDFWRNDDLEGWVSDRANNGNAATDPSDQFDRNGTDKASSSSSNAQSAGGTSGRSYKFDGTGERAYQPFKVEEGIEYSISAFVKTETTPMGDVEGTFYILRDEPADETNLASFAITTVPVISTALDTWEQINFSFTVDGTFNFPQDRVDQNATDILTSTTENFVIFYFVPTNTVTTDNEVFLTDVVISTPGF